MNSVETIVHPQVREELTRARAEDGAEVVVVRRPGFAVSAAHVGLRFGSNDLRFRLGDRIVEVPPGSAHYLEHKLFEGRDEKVFDRFARIGADFNGGTSFTTTTYYFTASQAFDAGLDVLLDFVQDVLLTEERVEKERGIIEQEVRMYDDHPSFHGVFLLHRALYHRHPIRHSPGGSVDDVRRITVEHLRDCWRAFYRPENLRIAIAGDLDPEAVLARVEGLLRQGVLTPPVERLGEEEPPTPAAALLEEDFRVTRPHVYVGWRDPEGPGLGAPGLRRRLLGSLALDLVFDLASPIHEDLYQRGVVDDGFRASLSVDADWSYAAAGGESDEPERFLAEVAAAAESARDRVREDDFERVRRAAFGRLVSSLQSCSAVAGHALHAMLQEVAPFAALDLLAGLRFDDVRARMDELFREERRAAAVLRPEG